MYAMFDVETKAGTNEIIIFSVLEFKETGQGWGSAIMRSHFINEGNPIHAVIKKEDIHNVRGNCFCIAFL